MPPRSNSAWTWHGTDRDKNATALPEICHSPRLAWGPQCKKGMIDMNFRTIALLALSGLALAATDPAVFVIGGAEIYRQAMPSADRLEITQVDLTPEGDSWFPEIATVHWQETAKTTPPDQTGTGYSFVSYRRRPA